MESLEALVVDANYGAFQARREAELSWACAVAAGSFKGLLRSFKGLIRSFKGLIRPLRAL